VLPVLYPLSLHDALPILISAIGCLLLLRSTQIPDRKKLRDQVNAYRCKGCPWQIAGHPSNDDSPKQISATLVERQSAQSGIWVRSEEHTSELQSRFDLVC